ncbi:sensor histidine kinase [Acinetobacter bouvetii]|uniref:histidine kinase n=1 Tax=Acinetobacter bouvetii TaxID=202951 RepID=A0A811GAE5_9GAMM|nr:ATP-binding protein [Acinetobacter bouvetii]CAB1214154.1 Oxygen sensor histidine kinase NreB [Acinetobacter bouvetii]
MSNPAHNNKSMLIYFGILLIIVLYIFQPTSTHASESINCTAAIQSIQVAKGNTHNESAHPTQGWISLKKLPDQWNTRWPDYHQNVWYKIQFNYHCANQPKTPLTLVIEKITQSGRVYINDELLWSDLSVQEPASRSQYMPRQWNIAASSLKEGQNILWVQVFGSITQKSGLGYLELGNYQNVYPIYKKWLLEKRTLIEFNAMISFVVGIFYFLAWLSNRKEKSFLWFAITNLCWILYSSCFLLTDPLPFTTTVLDRIQNIIFCFYTLVGCLAVWSFVHRSFPKLEKALWLFFSIALLCLSLAPLSHLNTVIQIFFGIAMVIFLAKCISFLFLAYQSKQPESYLMAAVYLLFIPIALHDAHFVISMEGHPLSPYTGPFTTLSLGAILGVRLARNARQIERFNKTLSEKVSRAKAELTESLDNQHQLALENARLQERIHLSHDLHDGLGGSIVRSILLLEQNDKIEKPQVMSILKLLRNDLRQVIDSGSSISAPVPHSPIDWVAPIRYRFVRLFEEMEIQSTWSFGQQWQTVPSSKQCLTLTRVVEEALTNILKHSQANKVSLQLNESEDKTLILQIQDNGIGFEPATVYTGLHVGLHSMQARISRMSGQFKIDSKPGQTIIQVILPLTETTQKAETIL